MQPPLSRLIRWPTAPLPSTQVAALAKRNCTAGSEAPAASATNVQSPAAGARLRCRAELFPGHGGGGAGRGWALAGSGWVSVEGGTASAPGSTWPTAIGAASARSKRVGGSCCSGSAAVAARVACVLGDVGVESSSMAAFGFGLTDSSKAAQAASSISTTQLDRATMGGQVPSPSSSSPSRRASRHLTHCPASRDMVPRRRASRVQALGVMYCKFRRPVRLGFLVRVSSLVPGALYLLALSCARRAAAARAAAP